MSLLLRILFYGALAGTVTSAIYCGMVLVGALRFARRKRREERAPVDYLPPVSVLKPLHGTEPDLEENLRGSSIWTIRSMSCCSARDMRAIRGCRWRGGLRRSIRRFGRGS